MRKTIVIVGCAVFLFSVGLSMAHAQTNCPANSSWDATQQSCACNNGYAVNSSGDSCISDNQVCQQQLGPNSYYGGASECYCTSGYVLNDAQTSCVPDNSSSASFSLAYGPFNFGNLLWFTIIIAVLYFIARKWGDSLNARFGKDVDEFVHDKSEKLVVQKTLLRSYGFLLLLMLPFLLALFVYAAFVTVMFGVLGIYVGAFVPFIGYWLALGLVLLFTGLALIVGFFRLFFPGKPKTLGIWLSEKENLKLWALTREVAEKLSTRPVDKILIKPDPGIGVYLQGPIFATLFGGGKKVLEVGIPSVFRLSVSEFTAILAHEYGHFNNRDTQWSTFTFSMGNSLRSALSSMPGPSQIKKGQRAGFMTILMALNPAYYVVLLFTMLYFKITQGFSRIREVMADITAMTLYGGAAFGGGLLKVATNDIIFHREIEGKHIFELLKQEKTIANFTKFMELLYDDATMQNVGQKLFEASGDSGAYDSHPALKTRISYAKRFPQLSSAAQSQFGTLFDNWEKINEDIANLYNARLAQILSLMAANANKKNTPPPKK